MANFKWQQDGNSGNSVFTDGANWIERTGFYWFTLHTTYGTATYRADTHQHAGQIAPKYIKKLAEKAVNAFLVEQGLQ